MDDAVFKKILKGARGAAAHAQGKHVPGMREYRIAVPSHVDVKATRSRMELTQESFAHMFGFPLSTVKKWESGQREPEAAARVLLKIIEQNPKAVLKALEV